MQFRFISIIVQAFTWKSSQIYLADWEFQNFVTLLGLIARRFGDPVGIEAIPKYSELNEPSRNPARRIS